MAAYRNRYNGYYRKLFESLPARKGSPSVIFRNWRNVETSSCGLNQQKRHCDKIENWIGSQRTLPCLFRASKEGLECLIFWVKFFLTMVWLIIRGFSVSEMHLGNFLDSMKLLQLESQFQDWNLLQKAEPHLTMQWIKEVEIAKSIGELMTSRSIAGRTDFPDYDMFDAMIAYALKKLLDRHVHFRRRVSVEE